LQQSASLNLSGIFLLHVVEFTLGPEIKLLPDNSWKLPAFSFKPSSFVDPDPVGSETFTGS
jgi:hypothetical protein